MVSKAELLQAIAIVIDCLDEEEKNNNFKNNLFYSLYENLHSLNNYLESPLLIDLNDITDNIIIRNLFKESLKYAIEINDKNIKETISVRFSLYLSKFIAFVKEIITDNVSKNPNLISKNFDINKVTGKIKQLEEKQVHIIEYTDSSLSKLEHYLAVSENQIKRLKDVSLNEIRALKNTSYTDIDEHLNKERENINKFILNSSEELRNSVLIKQKEILESLEDEITQIQNEIVIVKNNIIKDSDEAMSKFTIDINNMQRHLASELEKHTLKLDENLDINKKILLKEIKEEVGTYKILKSQLQHEFKSKTHQIEKIIGAISQQTLYSEHIKQANKEYTMYQIFQSFGLLFLLFSILFSVAIFTDSLGYKMPLMEWFISSIKDKKQDDISAGLWFIQRFSIVLLLTAPGLYLLKQAATHRHKENIYRQRGIQLAAITPYLDEFEKEERTKIKKELVKIYFSCHDNNFDSKNVPDFIRDMKETVKLMKSLDGSNKSNFINRNNRNTNKGVNNG